MNSKRRTKAKDIKRSLQLLLVQIELLIDAEESALEGIPENMLQRVERCEDAISSLQEAKTLVEDAVDQLETAVEL